MMPKQLPDVRSDTGFQADARKFADGLMTHNKSIRLDEFSEWLRARIYDAYMAGANNAIGIGYRLAEIDWSETVQMYKTKLKEHNID